MRNIMFFGDELDKIADKKPTQLSGKNKEALKKVLGGVLENNLTWRQQDCLKMYYFENMKMEEIAKQLGISKSTVSRHVAAAKKKLAVLRDMI